MYLKNDFMVTDEEAKNGDMVVTDKYGVWEFKDEGSGNAPIPYWANKYTCKKILGKKILNNIILIKF